jgi:hypothetical protein
MQKSKRFQLHIPKPQNPPQKKNTPKKKILNLTQTQKPRSHITSLNPSNPLLSQNPKNPDHISENPIHLTTHLQLFHQKSKSQLAHTHI